MDRNVLRYVVGKRDGICLYGLDKHQTGECSAGLDPHHITPRSVGGDDAPENLITLCRKHHNDAEAHVISPEELREILARRFGYEYE